MSKLPIILRVLFVLGFGVGWSSSLGCRTQATKIPFAFSSAQGFAESLESHLKRFPDDRDAQRRLAGVYWLHLNEKEKAEQLFGQLAEGGDAAAEYALTLEAYLKLDHSQVGTRVLSYLKRYEEQKQSTEKPTRRERIEHSTRALLLPAVLRLLEKVEDDVDPTGARFAQELSSLQLDGLDQESRRTVLGILARAERRQQNSRSSGTQSEQGGPDYRQRYQQQGCVQNWRLGQLEGHRGDLDLAEVAGKEFQSESEDGQRYAVPLSCAMRVWNPSPSPALRRLRTVFRTDETQLHLELAASPAIRVYLDGQEILKTDFPDRYLPKRHRLRMKVGEGEHLLEIAMAIGGEKSWFLVRATDEQGDAISHHSASEAKNDLRPFHGSVQRETLLPVDGSDLEDPVFAPLKSYLALDQALADQDSDRAESLAADLENQGKFFSAAHYLIAQFEEMDPSRSRSVSDARRRRAVEGTLELDPQLYRAKLEHLGLRLKNGESKEVLPLLDELPESFRDSLPALMFRFRAHDNYGSELEAELALQQAMKVAPQDCSVLQAAYRTADARDQSQRTQGLVDAMGHCDDIHSLRAQRAIRRGDFATAEALLKKALQRRPDELGTLEALSTLPPLVANLDAKGEQSTKAIEASKEFHKKILNFAPHRVQSWLNQSDLLLATGETQQAKALYEKAVTRFPYRSEIRGLGQHLSVDDPLLAWRENGTAHWERFLNLRRELAKSQEGSEEPQVKDIYSGEGEVMILDRDVIRLYEGGGSRHLIHQIFYLGSKAAIDRHGEFVPPDGATLLTMHSIKNDGRVVEPEVIAGKDGMSLRALEIGDSVEVEYILDDSPIDMLPGHFDTHGFYFQSPESPFHRSELIVLSPQSLSSKLKLESRNGAPPLVKTQLDAHKLTSWHFLATEVPRMAVEPNMRDLQEELPWVRIYTPLEANDWLDTFSTRLQKVGRTNPELRGLARKLVEESKNDEQKARALWQWVVENIENDGQMTKPVTLTLADRQGNQLLLLRSLLREVGVRTELWLARDNFGLQNQEGGHPLYEEYSTAILASYLDGQNEPQMILTGSKVMPLGYLTPAYIGAKAMRVHLDSDDGPAGPVTLPTPKKHNGNHDKRNYQLHLDLNDAGDGTLKGTIELTGLQAIQWREALTKIDRDRLPDVFEQAELAALAGGSTVSLGDLQLENEEDIEQPLRLHFQASVRGFGTRQDGELVLPLAPPNLNSARSFTTLTTRNYGLRIPYAPGLKVRFEITLHGLKFSSVPPSRLEKSLFGEYERKIVEGGRGSSKLVLELRQGLQAGIIPLEKYPALNDYATRVEQAESEVLRAR